MRGTLEQSKLTRRQLIEMVRRRSIPVAQQVCDVETDEKLVLNHKNTKIVGVAHVRPRTSEQEQTGLAFAKNRTAVTPLAILGVCTHCQSNSED